MTIFLIIGKYFSINNIIYQQFTKMCLRMINVVCQISQKL